MNGAVGLDIEEADWQRILYSELLRWRIFGQNPLTHADSTFRDPYHSDYDATASAAAAATAHGAVRRRRSRSV